MANQPTIADVLGVAPITIKHIKDGEKSLTVKQAIALENAYGMSIASLLKKEIAGKHIPKKLQNVHRAFLEFLKNDSYLKVPSTPEGRKQIQILENEEALVVEKVKELKQKAEDLKLEVKVLEVRKRQNKIQKKPVHKVNKIAQQHEPIS